MGKSGSAAVKSFDIPKALVWQAYYYGRFYRSRLYLLLQRINTYLMRWAGKKYKRLRSYRRFHAWWQESAAAPAGSPQPPWTTSIRAEPSDK